MGSHRSVPLLTILSQDRIHWHRIVQAYRARARPELL